MPAGPTVDDYVDDLVNAAPEFTAEQRTALQALLDRRQPPAAVNFCCVSRGLEVHQALAAEGRRCTPDSCARPA